MTKFAMKDPGDVSLILRIQVSRDRLKSTLDINQGNYVNAILQFGFVDSRSVCTLGLELGTVLDDSNKQLFQEIVGSLVYLSMSTS